jgi:tRNA/rRNA methyltransferase
VPETESEEAVAARARKRAWLTERNYRIVPVAAAAVRADAAQVLDDLAQALRCGG